MVRQAVPLQPMEAHRGAETHLQPGEGPTPEQGDAWRRLTLEQVCWQDLWTHAERSPRWSRFAGRTCDPMGDLRWSSLFLRDCILWKGPRWSSSWRTVSNRRDSTSEQGKCEEEGAAETVCDELIATPFPICLLGGQKVEKSGVRLSPEIREGWGMVF